MPQFRLRLVRGEDVLAVRGAQKETEAREVIAHDPVVLVENDGSGSFSCGQCCHEAIVPRLRGGRRLWPDGGRAKARCGPAGGVPEPGSRAGGKPAARGAAAI